MAEPFGHAAFVDRVIGRRAALAGLVAAGAALAGCARIPTGGPVVGPGDEADRQLPRVFAKPPREGSTPIQSVDGFLRAAAVGAVVTAREYLADPNVAWDADTEVVLHTTTAFTVVGGPDPASDAPPRGRPQPSGSASPSVGSGATPTPTPREGERAAVLVDVGGVVATLDGDGRMTLLDAPQTRRRRFGLVVRQGQWRIDELEDGVTITLGQFVTSSAYQPTPIYFPDVTGRWLVPDVRYVRQQSDSTQTVVVNALLEGPSPWLADGLELPAKSPRLKVSSVPVSDGGLATVDLTEDFLGLDERGQQLLRRQLEASLVGLRGPTVVTAVEVTVDGQLLRGSVRGAVRTEGDLPNAPSSPGVGAFPETAERAHAGTTYVAVDDKARIVTGQGTQVRLVDRLALTGGARPGMSYTDDGRTYALVVAGRSPGQRTLKVAEAGTRVFDVTTAPDLTPPSFDGSGWVWTSPRRGGGSVVAGLLVGGRVRRVVVDARWLAGRQVVSLRVSREGARALLLVDAVTGDGRRSSSLLLCAVVRRDDGEPVALGAPVRLVPDLVRASDAGWLDDQRVVVLGSRRSTGGALVVQPWVVDIGGDPSSRGITSTAPLGAIVTEVDGKPAGTTARWERLGLDLAPSLAVGDGLDDLYVATARALFRYRQTGSWESLRVNAIRPAFPG